MTGGRDGVVRVWFVTKSAFLEPGYVQQDQAFRTAFQQTPTHLPSGVTSPALREFRGHVADVIKLDVNRDNYILSVGQDKTVRLWHCLKSVCLAHFSFPRQITAARWDPFDTQVFYAADLGNIYAFDLRTGRRTRVSTPGAVTVQVLANALFVFQVCANGFVAVRDRKTLGLITRIEVHSSKGRNAGPQRVTAASLTQSLNELLVLSQDQRLRVYSTWSGSPLQKFKDAETSQSVFSLHQFGQTAAQKSVLNEGPAKRVQESVCLVPGRQALQFLLQFHESPYDSQLAPGQINVKEFSPVAVQQLINDDYVQLQLDFKAASACAL